MKIKNIIFDLGGVLIDFKPQIFLRHIGFSEEEMQQFYRIVFCGEEWNQYNKSQYNESQVRENLIKRYPEYAEKINMIFDHIDYSYILFLMEDTSDYLKELKRQGYRIYILSDLSADSFAYNKQFDFFDYTDGGVYSFEIESTKPNKKNYEEILNKYGLIPEETIFIDDNMNNVVAANEFGINGIQFDNLKNVKQKVKSLLNQ